MKSQDIVKLESGNASHIYLFLEGKFWRAYEHSAYAVCSYIRAFTPIKRQQKVLSGGSIVMIGFPISTLDSVIKGQQVISIGPKQILLASPKKIDVNDFEKWKYSLEIYKTESRAKQQIPLPESHEQTPSYKAAWEILVRLYTEPCIESVSREFKYGLLDDLRNDAVSILSGIYRACYTREQDKMSVLESVITGLYPLRIRARLLYETRAIPENFYLKLCDLFESLSSQLSLWKRAVSVKYDNSRNKAGIVPVTDEASEP